jgi:hypothetical protein
MLAFITAEGKRLLIPDEVVAAYGKTLNDAKIMLDKASQTQDRTATVTAQINETFGKFNRATINLKRQYLTVPPLTDADLVACQLRPADTTPTEIRTPSTSCNILVKTLGPGVVRLDFEDYGNLSPEVRAMYGVRYYWGIMRAVSVLRLASGGEPTIDEYKAACGKEHYLLFPPEDGEIMAHSKYTGRKREVLYIKGEAGNVLYLCARYETPTGDSSPWGPVAKIVIT